MGSLFAVQLGQPGLGVVLAARDFPASLAGLDCAVGVKVIWIVGATLAVGFALQAADFCLAGLEFVAELLEQSPVLADGGDCGGADIQSDFALADEVLGFVIGLALAYQLDTEAVVFTDLAAHQADIFDWCAQSVLDDRVIGIDDRFQF